MFARATIELAPQECKFDEGAATKRTFQLVMETVQVDVALCRQVDMVLFFYFSEKKGPCGMNWIRTLIRSPSDTP